MTMTMTMMTGPTGGRENANSFAGYVDKDNDDDPIGGRRGEVAPKRQHGRRMEKKKEEEDDDEGMASGDNDSGEGKDTKGGMEYAPFFKPLMAWDDGRTTAALTAAHNNQIVKMEEGGEALATAHNNLKIVNGRGGERDGGG